MKDYGIYEKVKLNGIVPGRLIRHTRADSAIIKKSLASRVGNKYGFLKALPASL